MTRDELLLFGVRLRRYREKAYLTQEKLAEKVDISLRFYQSLELGTARPSLKTLIALSRTLNVSIDYLLLGEISNQSRNPILEIYQQLSPRQRDDAYQIMQLYFNACQDSIK